MVDLKELATPKFDIEITGVGSVSVDPFSFGIEIEMQSFLKTSPNTPDTTFACRLLALVGHRPGSSERIELPEVIPDSDLENFAARFVETNRWLIPKDSGASLARNDGESSCKYLLRIFSVRRERNHLAMKSASALVEDHFRRMNQLDKILESNNRLLRQADFIYGSHLDLFSNTAVTATELAQQLTGVLSRTRSATDEVDRLITQQIRTESNLSAYFDAQKSLALEVTEQLNALYRLPLVDDFRSVIDQLRVPTEQFRNLMDSIKTPWININTPSISLAGAGQLASIGEAINELHFFDENLQIILRETIGDWRKVAIPEDIYLDPFRRLNFYTGLGFNRDLTDFPSPAFDELVRGTGIRPDRPPVTVRRYERLRANLVSADPTSVMTYAYEMLYGFESQIREFIDRVMTEEFGDDWVRHQVPGPVRQAWEDKREKAKEAGEPNRPLIAYADFTDYVSIICKGDNWRRAFEPFFDRKEKVQESFVRLYPIRLCTMHARPITQDDMLLLYVEVNLLLKALKSGS